MEKAFRVEALASAAASSGLEDRRAEAEDGGLYVSEEEEEVGSLK